MSRMLGELRRGRAQRALSALTALSALPLGLEIYFEHFRGSFGDKWMWTPVALSPLLSAAGVAGVLSRRAATTALPAVIFQELIYLGYFMIIILAGAMSIPESFYEAAQLDGAHVWQQERFITLPMVRGILVTAMTLAIAFGLRQFESTYLMTGGGPANSTMVMGLLLYQNLGSLDYGTANSIGAILVILGGALIVTIRRVFGERNASAEAKQ